MMSKALVAHLLGVEYDNKVLMDRYPTKVLRMKKSLDNSVKKALKMVFKEDSAEGRKALRHFVKEVNILSKLNHPHIVIVDSVATLPKFNCILMPYYDGGNLTQILPYLNWHVSDHYLVQLCSALTYLRWKNIVHRDVKTDNVLLNTNHHIVLADFGLSDVLPPGQSMIKHIKGTIYYMAPEQSNSVPYDGFKSDMFALGVILWCMIMRMDVILFKPEQPLVEIVKSTTSLSPIDSNILCGLLEMNPDERWSITTLVNSLSGFPRFATKVQPFKERGLL
nr:NUAK family SNF1-like kinase 2 [Biomphalaria glabrata]